MPSKTFWTFALFLSLSSPFSSRLAAQTAPDESGFRGEPLNSSLVGPAIEKKIDNLLKQMTLDEKVGQLVQYTSGAPMGPSRGSGNYPEMAAEGALGSLFNIEGAHAANEYQRIAVERSRLHIPLLFGLDVIHGYRTTLPIPLALASTWDPEIVEQGARMAAEEASANGVRWTFSPMVDISRDARWGRITESAGEDPYLASVMARAYVRGYQGTRLDAPNSVAACVKHFVGYGAAEAGRDYNTTEISEHTLREVYLPPFYAALEQGSPTIMSSFNALDGVPATANPFTLTEILRKEWKFPGLAVSDYTAVAELVPHGIALDGRMAALRAFSAGLDMDMESGLYHQYLASLVKGGQIGEARLDESVRRVLRVKFALGLFEHPYTDESREVRGALSAANLETARKAAERSFVLLKNDAVGARPLLPLADDTKTVALIGPLADDARDMLGSWECRGRPSDVMTLRTALVQKLGGDRVRFTAGGEVPTATDQQIGEAVALAEGADLVILALGESGPEMTGEAASRAHLKLPGRQEELLEKVMATGRPVVLVLFNGRPLTLPWAFAHVPAVMAAWFPGVQAGPAIVNMLFGNTAPSGRLVVTWPRAVGQEPLYYNALNTGRPPTNIDLTRPPRNAPEKFVSRYIDEPNTPQFPFGFGLTYTTFSYSKPEVTTTGLSARTLNESLRVPERAEKEVLAVSATVTNTGSKSGEAVVQLYIGLQGTSVEEPVRKLEGFQKVQLAPGENKRISFPLTPAALAIWNINNNLTLEPSRLNIWVSGDSATGESTQVEITP